MKWKQMQSARRTRHWSSYSHQTSEAPHNRCSWSGHPPLPSRCTVWSHRQSFPYRQSSLRKCWSWTENWCQLQTASARFPQVSNPKPLMAYIHRNTLPELWYHRYCRSTRQMPLPLLHIRWYQKDRPARSRSRASEAPVPVRTPTYFPLPSVPAASEALFEAPRRCNPPDRILPSPHPCPSC